MSGSVSAFPSRHTTLAPFLKRVPETVSPSCDGGEKDEPFGLAGHGRAWFPGTTRSVFARFVPSPQVIPALKPFVESWHFSIPALHRWGAVRLVKPDSPRS